MSITTRGNKVVQFFSRTTIRRNIKGISTLSFEIYDMSGTGKLLIAFDSRLREEE